MAMSTKKYGNCPTALVKISSSRPEESPASRDWPAILCQSFLSRREGDISGRICVGIESYFRWRNGITFAPWVVLNTYAFSSNSVP